MIKAIISDSDGTLVNTLYLIRHGQYEATVKHLLSRGVPREDIPDYETFESYINKSVGGKTRETLEASLQLLYRGTHDHYLKNLDLDELDRDLQPIQDQIAPLYVHPFHGLSELFTWLGTKSISLGIFTSGSAYHIIRNYGIALPVLGYTDLYLNTSADNAVKLKSFTDRVMAVYGIPKLTIVTADDVTKTKPEPEGIIRALNLLGLKASEVIAMGDHPFDMMAARAAGMHPIGTTHGFSTAADLKAAGAVRTVSSLLEIPGLVDAHNEGSSPLFH